MYIYLYIYAYPRLYQCRGVQILVCVSSGCVSLNQEVLKLRIDFDESSKQENIPARYSRSGMEWPGSCARWQPRVRRLK